MTREQQVAEFFETLTEIQAPDDMMLGDVVDCYLRATFDAAGIKFDEAFHKDMLLRLASQEVA